MILAHVAVGKNINNVVVKINNIIKSKIDKKMKAKDNQQNSRESKFRTFNIVSNDNDSTSPYDISMF